MKNNPKPEHDVRLTDLLGLEAQRLSALDWEIQGDQII